MDKLQTVDVTTLKEMFPDMSEIEMGGEFFLGHIKPRHIDSRLSEPFRMDGYVSIVCLDGEADVDINLKSFHLSKNMAFIYIPGNILQVRNIQKDSHYIIFAMSARFVSSLSLDINSLFNDSMAILAAPCFNMTEEELHLCASYAQLAKDLIDKKMVCDRREALTSLIASVYYAVGATWRDRINKARDIGGLSQSSRDKAIFDHFTHLVHEHHLEHRDLAFYSDIMQITPKYLSRVVKQVSGRTAPEWIDSFVVIEAKNMLKHSDMSIKEIISRLNFSSHAVFYTFFKNRTGMTPTQYRESR